MAQLDVAVEQKGPMSVEKFDAIVKRVLNNQLVYPARFLALLAKEAERISSFSMMTKMHYEIMTAMNLMTIVSLDEQVDQASVDMMDKLSSSDWEIYFAARVDTAFAFLPQIIEARAKTDGSMVPLMKKATEYMRRLLADMAAPEWTEVEKESLICLQAPVATIVITAQPAFSIPTLTVTPEEAEYNMMKSLNEEKEKKHKKQKQRRYTAAEEGMENEVKVSGKHHWR